MHGVGVAHIDEQRPATPPVADAAVTRTPRVVLAVQIADCMPVLLSSRDGRLVAVAHAGWRGLAAGVVESTIAAMRVDTADIVAWLGPAIGPNAFEVGDDVLRAFGAVDDASTAFTPLREGKWLADLRELARRRLARAGVRDIAIDASCTYSERERFFSYRRDGETGRMVALIWIDRVA